MFISVFKLAVIALVIAVVWSLLKPTPKQAAPRPTANRKAGPTPQAGVEELVKCDRCGTYVASVGAKPCGRANCPNV